MRWIELEGGQVAKALAPAIALTVLAAVALAFLAAPRALSQEPKPPSIVSVDTDRAVQNITGAFEPIAPPRPDGAAGRIAKPEPRVFPSESAFAGWSTINLRNEGPITAERLLVFTYPALANTGIFGAPFREPRIVNVRHAEGAMPLTIPSSGLANRFAMLGVRIAPGETHVIALQIEGGNNAVGVNLWDPGAIQRYDTFLLLMIGVFWGVLLVGISLMFAMRLMGGRGVMLTGGFFALSALVFESASFGFGGANSSALFGLAGETIVGIIRSLSLVMTGFFGLMFLRLLLNLKEEAPMADIVVRIVAFALLLAIPPIFLGDLGPLAARLAALTALIAAGVVVWQVRRFLPSALRLVPPGWSLLLIGALASAALSLSGLGLVSLIAEPVVHGLLVVGVTLLVLAAAVQATQDTGGFAIETVPGFMPAAAPEPSAARSEIGAQRPSQGRAYQGLWDWRVGEDKLYVSPAIEAMLGLTEGALGKSESAWAARIVDADRSVYRDSLKHYLDQGNSTFALEFRVRAEDGTVHWVQLRATGLAGEEGSAARVIGLVTDISAAKAIEEELVREASHDPLTGAGNRALLLSHLDWALTASRAKEVLDATTGLPLKPALIVLDIDRFRTVNDGLGHAAGDQLLIQVARRLEKAIGSHDILARIGSDEFAVLLTPTQGDTAGLAHMTDAEELAASLAHLVGQPMAINGQTVYPTTSIGIVRFDERHRQGQEVLADAEAALRTAKKRGGGETQLFEPRQRQSPNTALSLEADLRQAIAKEQMLVLFQPILSGANRSIAGFEALLRWQHPERGLLAPKDFVPLAEETGLIVTIGRYALSMAALQLSHWQTYFPLHPALFMTVNVSSRQLLKASFLRDVADVLEAAKLAPGSLKLEVTESMVFADEERAGALLAEISRIGVNLVLDDYGTGYSSLSRLKSAPFSTVKIDRAFIAPLGEKSDAGAIVKSTIQMAHDLGLEVVAEGVEKEEQMRVLESLGCDLVQGYLFGRAASAEEAMRFIALNWKVRTAEGTAKKSA